MKLIKHPNGVMTLQDGEQQKTCPYQNGIPMKTNLGQLALQKQVCASDCACFNYDSATEILKLHCMPNTREIHNVRITNFDEKKSNLTIIK